MGLRKFLFLVVVAGLVAVEGHRASEILRRIVTEPFPMGEGNSRCQKDSETYIQALGRLEGWAINMYDSTSKIPSGILAGNTVLLGQYDQCLAVEGPEFKGQYCNVHVDVNLVGNVTAKPGSLRELLMSIDDKVGDHQHSYRWSLCVPSSCDLLDVKKGFQTALDPLNTNLSGTTIRVLDIACSAVKWQAIGIGDYLFFTLAFLIILVVIASTAYDICVINNFVDETEQLKRVRCLSLRTSWLRLMESKRFPGRINCLSGLRFYSVAWIILAHAAYTVGVPPNMESLELNSWKFMLSRSNWANAYVATDTLLLLAGFTLTMNFIKHCKLRQGPPKIYMFWLRIIVTILPAYAFVVFFHATSVRLIGDGPLWDRIVGSEARRCVNYWWANLLFISNFFEVEDQCINQSWLIAAEMQMNLVIGTLLYAVWKYFNKTLVLVRIFILLIIVTIIVPFAIPSFEGLPGKIISDNAEIASVYETMHIQVYMRAEPFLFGMAMGYFMSYFQGRALPLNRVYVTLLWGFFGTMILPITVLSRNAKTSKPNVYVLSNAFYMVSQCTGTSMLVSWLILACYNGFSGPIDYILSFRFLEPLEKVARCTFLAHFVFTYYAVGIRLTPDQPSAYVVLLSVIGLLTASIVAGILLFLFIEQPINSLMRSFGRETATVSEHEMQVNMQSEDMLSSNEQTEMSNLENLENLEKPGTGSEDNEGNAPTVVAGSTGTSGTSGPSLTSVSSPTPSSSDSQTMVERTDEVAESEA